MRYLPTGLILTVSFLAFGTLAQAQFGPPDGPYQPDSVSTLVDRVQQDLNQGYSVWHLSGGDHDRLNHAGSELRDFSRDWRKGKFNKGNLDDSIHAVQKVLNDNHLSGPERDALWNDVEQLRRMREAYDRHEIGRW
jgi:hypothetical protein